MSSETIDVYSYCAYLTNVDLPWRAADYTALKAVKCVKDEGFNGYLKISTRNGKNLEFTESNRHDFVPIAARTVARVIREKIGTEVALVPIPNSHCTSSSVSNFRTNEFANIIGDRLSMSVFPCLLFKEQAESYHHSGRYRDPHEIFENYKIEGKRPKSPVILIDDVMTTGAHIKAAYWKLQEEQIGVKCAVTFGWTTKEQVSHPISLSVRSIDISKSDGNVIF